MMVFKYGDCFFCYLCNPKCGTHTFYSLWYYFLLKFVTEIYTAPLNLMNSGYSNYNYYHCNLTGAIKFFEEKQISLENVVFFTTIRNPFERVLSNYWYSLRMLNINKFDNSLTQQEDFDKFLLTPHIIKEFDIKITEEEFDNYDLKPEHYKNFEPKNFRFSENSDIHVDVLRLENWDEDFEIFSRIHNFPENKKILLNTIKINDSKRSSQLAFNDKTIEYIINNYSIDFKDGNYDLQPK